MVHATSKPASFLSSTTMETTENIAEVTTPPPQAPTTVPGAPLSEHRASSLPAGTNAHHPYQHRHHRSNKSAGVILIDPWSYNYNDPATYRIMVVQQKGSGVWGLPKGHLEPGETLYEAALREMREETGVHLLSDNHNNTQANASLHEGALREHVDFVPVPLKMVPMMIQEVEASVDEACPDAAAAVESPPADALSTTTAPKPHARGASLYRNHVQIKKIHFFVFVLRRSGQSLVPAPVDSHEIIRVSWLNVQSWNVDALECLRAAGYTVPIPKFNRTLSDGAVTTLQEVARKVGVQMATHTQTQTHTRGAMEGGALGGGGYGGRFRFLSHFMDPPTLATTALFTPVYPAIPVLYLGGALALTTIVVCGWMVEKTLRARREARLSTGTLYRSESEIELMDYTRIPDAEKPPTERENEAIFM